MIKLVYCITKRPDLSDEEFFHYWKNIHGPIGATIPRLRKLIQSHRINIPGDKHPPSLRRHRRTLVRLRRRPPRSPPIPRMASLNPRRSKLHRPHQSRLLRHRRAHHHVAQVLDPRPAHAFRIFVGRTFRSAINKSNGIFLTRSLTRACFCCTNRFHRAQRAPRIERSEALGRPYLLADHDRGPEALNAFILFHKNPSIKPHSMVPSGISRSLGIPNRRGGKPPITTSNTIRWPANIRARLLQNDARPHAGRRAVSTAANKTTV